MSNVVVLRKCAYVVVDRLTGKKTSGATFSNIRAYLLADELDGHDRKDWGRHIVRRVSVPPLRLAA